MKIVNILCTAICHRKQKEKFNTVTSYDLTLPLLGSECCSDSDIETIYLSEYTVEQDEDDAFFSSKMNIESKINFLEGKDINSTEKSYIKDSYKTLTAISDQYKDKILLDKLQMDDDNVYQAARVALENRIQKERLKEVDNILLIEKPITDENMSLNRIKEVAK